MDLYHMSSGYQIDKQDAAYFLTMTTVEWVDIFIQNEYKYFLCDSLNYCVNEKGLEVFAYVIMSTHLHMIARAKNANLSDVVRDFKKYTSGKLISKIKMEIEIKNLPDKDQKRNEMMMDIFEHGGKKQKKKSIRQLWQYNNHPEEVYSPKFTLTKIKYIHNNPVEAGLVNRPEQYCFSSAVDYAGKKGPVEVSIINLHNLFYT